VYGGGIYITNGSLLMTDSAAVTLNTATAGHQPAAATPASQAYGGGLSADISSLLIKDNAKVEGNRAESYVGYNDVGSAANGGGIVLFSSSLLKLQGNAAVRNNTAQAVTSVMATPRASAAGGGIFVRLSIVEMDGGSVSGNKALGGAPAGYVQGAQIYGKGGGIYVLSGAAYMRGGEISGNTAAAGTIPAETVSPNRTATNNSESAGGGIYSEGNLYLSGGVIRDNVAGSAAGASPGMGGAVAKFGTSGSIHLSGAIRIPYNNTPLNGNEDRRNAVAVQMASTMANTTANHQNAPILIDGAFTVTEPVVADIRSYTAGGAVTDFAANGARALFWWRDGTVRPPLPGRVTLGRFYELNSTTSSADYYRFNPTDISASYELNGEGKVQAR
jgi:hypothetical protein